MKNVELAQITNLGGIGAVFARGFMEMYETQERRLRQCQEGGQALVEELDSTISVPYISKISRLLTEAGVVGRTKVGRKFYVTDGKNLNDFMDWMNDNPDWGSRLTGSQDDDLQRLKVLEHLDEHGCVLSTADNRIPKAAYKLLMQKVQAGTLDIVFVKTGLPMGVKHKGSTHRAVPLDD